MLCEFGLWTSRDHLRSGPSLAVELISVFEDRGVSGASPLDRRPGLLAALECMDKSRAV
jgi:hypothetical protein